MSHLLDSPVLWGVAAGAMALLIVAYLIISPGPTRLALQRRRPGAEAGPTLLTRATTSATSLLDRALGRRGAGALEQAGVRMRLQDFALLVIVASLVLTAAGVVLAGWWLGLLLGLAAPVLARVVLGVLAGRRRRAFAEQLDDALQLMASSLRAGHSLLQALASVSREAEEPSSEEFSRVINETRVGREVGQALDETAKRMRSDDFDWVVQAIAINREVGGNLAEVLDGVGHTIRERNQIRRQVQALSAEGKLSAFILMALPVGIVAFLGISNPAYIAKFTQSLAGYGMIAAGIVLMIVGAAWLRKVVTFKF